MSEQQEFYAADPAPQPAPQPEPSRRFLNAADILAIPDIETEDVWIEQWGTFVRVRGLSAAERDAYEMGLIEGRGKNVAVNRRNVRAKLVVRACIAEDGSALFDLSQVDKLGQKSGAAIDKLYDVAARLSGISDADAEELGKPSERDPSGDSSSG
jgi:hypothetical protein